MSEQDVDLVEEFLEAQRVAAHRRLLAQGFRLRGPMYNRVVDDEGPSLRSVFPFPFLADGSSNPDYLRAIAPHLSYTRVLPGNIQHLVRGRSPLSFAYEEIARAMDLPMESSVRITFT
ncbi:MAG: hypothetical protein OEQ18_04800 [Gammaproteobacteria bacterium]|nr:hypothetical protein [Gammaproteobacteria bacterium]